MQLYKTFTLICDRFIDSKGMTSHLGIFYA